MPHRFRYSPWDGTQLVPDLEARSLWEEMTDDLAQHGDVNAALRRLLQEGFEDPSGQRVEGLRDLVRKLADRRRELAEGHDLGGVVDGITAELRDVLDAERDEIERQDRAAHASGDEELIEAARDSLGPRRARLDLLAPDLASQVRELRDYRFLSPSAQEGFDSLVERLTEQILGSTVERLAGGMRSLTPEDIARTRDMIHALNEMLEERSRGDEPDFEGFMERFGDFFPENPRTLDELLEIMGRRVAAFQALMNSLDPAQRAQLQELAEELLGDLDLQWEMDRLGANLRSMFPELGWAQRYEMSGVDPLDLAGAADLMNQMGEIDELERLLRSAAAPGALDEVDLDRVRELLGEDAARSVGRLSELRRLLEEDGLVRQREGRMELTPKGIRRLGQNALAEVFRRLRRDRLADHDLARSGIGHERTYRSRPWEFGDPFQLDLHQTVRNAVLREVSSGERGGGARGVGLTPDDFAVEEVEQQVRCSTVLMLDLSLSMPMRGYFVPAKKVALALQALISTQFPRDYLGIVGFAESARILGAEELPEVSWDFVYGTNMEHGFRLSRDLLARQSGTKQILMVTDGEPTAHIDPRSGEPVFAYPPRPETRERTLAEAMRCTRAGITINTFMLQPDRGLQRFVERLTALNRGRAFFAEPGNLGDFVLVDFMEQRRRLLQAARH